MTFTQRWAAVLLGSLTLLALAGCAGVASTVSDEPTTPSATPSAPVVAVDVAAGEVDGDVEVSVPANAEGVGVTFREITIAPGAGTGEHCHYGQLIAAVKQGTLTHYAPTYPGGVHEYEEGDAIIEGAGYIHEGVNEGDVDVVLWVTYVIPEGEPLAETDLTKCDT
jgi:quercetin dioxygenase-like cupin family protein